MENIHMRKAMLLIAVFGLVGALWAADPFIGTWERNVAKSTATNKSMMPTREIMKNEIQGDIYKWTWEGMEGQYSMEWSGKYDEVLYPVKGNPYVDMASVKKLKTNSLLFVQKMAGKSVGKWRYTVSKDGKTLTVKGRGKTPIQRKNYGSTQVYEKQ